MSSYIVWKYAHILMFVFWVGTDMGVFLAARRCTDRTLSFVTRVTLLHMALRIELLPRTMWKAALPFGVMLSRDMGLLPISAGTLAAVWVFSIAWWAISMTGAWYYDKPFGHRLGRITNGLTLLVGGCLIALALSSMAGHGPIEAEADWLQLKVGLYGLINLFVVWMIVAFDPLGAAFGRLAVEGSRPEIEAIISQTMNRSTLVIWATYLLIVIVGFIGTTKLAG
ncbi:MAG: hypothetical protein KJ049_04185 [Gammaproteobacteria bacterium]|jgi:hypothetical protein|nr:hypothetical protein [Gammaproteobacteria bacterium]